MVISIFFAKPTNYPKNYIFEHLKYISQMLLHLWHQKKTTPK